MLQKYLQGIRTTLICLLFSTFTYAQEEVSMQGFGFETNLMAGKIIKHSKKFTAPIPYISTALDMNFVWQTYGKKDWQQRRNYPLIGFGFTYTDYGNNEVFGNCLGVYPELQVPIIRKNNFEWTIRFGNGLGYVTRKYQKNPPVDTLNTAIGTNFNDFAIFCTDIRWHINHHWNVQAGANFTHISNADYHSPNLGVNMVGAHLGVRYFPTTSNAVRIKKNLEPLPNRWLFEARIGIAHNEARSEGNPELPTYLTSLYMSHRWLSKNKWYVGIDAASHEDVYQELKYWTRYVGNERAHSWDGGIFAGNEFLVGRIGIFAQVGIYYKQTYLKFDPFYEKIGLNYYVIKREKGPVKEVFLSSILLTHAIVAELAEFGIGAGF